MQVQTTSLILQRSSDDERAEAIALGAELGTSRHVRHPALVAAREDLADTQAQWGLDMMRGRLLTAPGSNTKLAKADMPIFGLTLQSTTMRSTLLDDAGRRITINSCPNAGDCTRVCVIKNNRGRMDNTQLAWQWRTDFFVRTPTSFLLLLSFELARAIRDLGWIGFRPNVDSDLRWERIAPTMFDGSVFGDALLGLGYTKLTNVLSTDGWLLRRYRVAFSANEDHRIDEPAVVEFLRAGGSVSVVTDRVYRPHHHEPIKQWHPQFDVLDADYTDEWILLRNVIGDLAFKTDRADLADFARTSNFIHRIYHPEVPA